MNERERIARTFGEFTWPTSDTCVELVELFGSCKFRLNELIHLVRFFLEVRRKVTSLPDQDRIIGRENLRTKILIQKWIHGHWSEMQDFFLHVVIQLPGTGRNHGELVGPERETVLQMGI
jgi:hypothetical protein